MIHMVMIYDLLLDVCQLFCASPAQSLSRKTFCIYYRTYNFFGSLFIHDENLVAVVVLAGYSLDAVAATAPGAEPE